MKKLLILALLFSIKQADAQVCFSLPTDYPVGSGASAVVSADFNGDGFADMAVTNNADGNVSILLGTGTGTFGTATSFSVGSGPYSLCSADFNGDGKADLAVTNYSANSVSILLGNGAGSFSAANNIPVLGYSPVSITTADFNMDGFKDLVTANFGANNASILLGTGTGNFNVVSNQIITYSVGIAGGTQPHSVTSGDYNGDGLMDVAFGNYGSNNISVLLGQGWGGFDTATVYAIGSGSSASAPFTIISTDLNGDGKIDLAAAAASSSTGYAAVFIGTGTGSFPPASVNTIIGANGTPTGMTSGDFNADGKIDLAVVDQSTDNVYVLLGSGTGTAFPAMATFALGAGSAPNAIITSDFDGNAKPDLAVANWNLNNAAVLLGASLPNITATAAVNPNCAGSRDSLFGGGGVSYVWTGASGIQDGVGFVTATTKTYTVTGTDANGCTNKTVQTITVNPVPTLTVVATPSVICAGQTTVLNASGASTYTWNTSAVGSSLTISPTGSTVYTVTGTNSNGCKSSKSYTVTISPNLTVTASPSHTVCAGDSVLLVVKTIPASAATYTWSTATINDSVYVHPTANATYSVIATSTVGCQNTATVAIVVDAAVPPAPVAVPPALTAIAGSTTVCASSVHAYLITSTVPGAYSYVWTLPSGWSAATSTTTAISATVGLNSGTVSIAAKNTCGLSPTATLAVNVNPLPVVTIAGSADTVCYGQTAHLTAHGASTYVWSIGTATVSALTVTVTPVSNATYTVKGTDGNGCASTASFTISGSPIVTTTSFNHSVSSHTVCLGDSILLIGHGAANYSWSSTASTNDSIYVHPTDTAKYIVTGTNGNGCSKRDTTKIYVDKMVPAAPSALLGPTSICAYSSNLYYIPAAVAGAYSYTWSYPAGWHGPTSVTAGNITVTDSTNSGTIAVSGKNTCGLGTAATLFVTVNALPAVSFVLNPNDTACLNNPTQITVATPAGGSYSGPGITFWTGSFNPNTAGGVGPKVINYYYKDANGCSNTAKDTMFVKACAGIGVQSYAANNSMRIYPNPNNGTFVIETNSQEAQTVQVFDVNGKMVMNQNIRGNISIDATSLTEGIYSVKLLGAQGVVNKKLVIVK